MYINRLHTALPFCGRILSMATSISEGYRSEFMRTFHEIVKDLTVGGATDPHFADAMMHLRRVKPSVKYFSNLTSALFLVKPGHQL